jgi:hypothetical protein
MVMIDVEGAEIRVLRGMRSLLTEHRPVICCEVHWLGEQFTDFVRDELVPLGYELATMVGGAPVTGIERWHAVLRPST